VARGVRTLGDDNRVGVRVEPRGVELRVVVRGALEARGAGLRVERVVVALRSRPDRCGNVTERVPVPRVVVARGAVVPRGDVVARGAVVARGVRVAAGRVVLVDVVARVLGVVPLGEVVPRVWLRGVVADRSDVRVERFVLAERCRFGVAVLASARVDRALRAEPVAEAVRFLSVRRIASEVWRMAVCGNAADRVRADRRVEMSAVRIA
jgi:hypothetical protein